MNAAVGLFFKENIAGWIKTRGFILILVAALVPVGLTAAWVGTHQGDIAVTAITWDPERIQVGEPVNFTVSLSNVYPRDAPTFNLTVRVGFYEPLPTDQTQVRFRSVFTDRVAVPGIPSDGTYDATARWTPGTADLGSYFVEAIADPDQELRETRTDNNYYRAQVQVFAPASAPLTAPPPSNQTQDGNATDLPRVDARIVHIDHPAGIYVNDQVNVTVAVANAGPENLTGASLTIRVERERFTGSFADERITDIRAEWVEVRTVTRAIDVAAGSEAEEEMSFTANNVARYRVVATLDVSEVAFDEDTSGHQSVQFLQADRRDAFEEPPAGESAHTFYRSLVLDFIHLKLLVPLIALFFAAGVLEDERRRNALPYLLTRPVPRWTIPLVRFAVSFVVAGVAIVIGVLGVNALLLGQPGADVEFLLWPLGLTLGALFVYGAVFTLLGVWTQRPYLWGLLYILGFEFLIYFGRNLLLVNGRPMFQSMVEWFSLNHWFLQVFSAWDPTRTQAPWLETPESSAMVAAIGLLGMGIAALIAAAVTMERRDFEG